MLFFASYFETGKSEIISLSLFFVAVLYIELYSVLLDELYEQKYQFCTNTKKYHYNFTCKIEFKEIKHKLLIKEMANNICNFYL